MGDSIFEQFQHSRSSMMRAMGETNNSEPILRGQVLAVQGSPYVTHAMADGVPILGVAMDDAAEFGDDVLVQYAGVCDIMVAPGQGVGEGDLLRIIGNIEGMTQGDNFYMHDGGRVLALGDDTGSSPDVGGSVLAMALQSGQGRGRSSWDISLKGVDDDDISLYFKSRYPGAAGANITVTFETSGDPGTISVATVFEPDEDYYGGIHVRITVTILDDYIGLSGPQLAAALNDAGEFSTYVVAFFGGGPDDEAIPFGSFTAVEPFDLNNGEDAGVRGDGSSLELVECLLNPLARVYFD